ncbi:MAG: DUF1566 domain-containing protein [bacterium]|nr:DUF1566 domain-containing protein [bacterium]
MKTTDRNTHWLIPLTIVVVAIAAGCSDDATKPPVDDDDPIVTVTGYPLVDTNQNLCYATSAEIAAPAAGEAFYGQDAQHDGAQPSYTVSDDGLTVYDNVTGLTWVAMPDTDGDGVLESPDDKLTWTEAQSYPATLNGSGFGDYDDWRLPTIKELYSLILFSGEDVAPEAPSGDTPFIDTDAFEFVYGNTAAMERVIDSQYASSTLYVAPSAEGQLLFGVNFADGRIKGYGLTMPGMGDKTFFVQCCRGNTDYGVNDYADNGDATVTDAATGLMWMQDDSGVGMNLEEALAWVEARNAESYLGHGDWRLPNVKELESIVDYTRSPATTASAAIDPVFDCTVITNEAGEDDYAFYWSGTTHVSTMGAMNASYVAFGRSLGYMNGSWVDVHGAGSQRSDPKEGDPADFPTGHGPQGDAIRIYNYVRLVRDAG